MPLLSLQPCAWEACHWGSGRVSSGEEVFCMVPPLPAMLGCRGGSRVAENSSKQRACCSLLPCFSLPTHPTATWHSRERRSHLENLLATSCPPTTLMMHLLHTGLHPPKQWQVLEVCLQGSGMGAGGGSSHWQGNSMWPHCPQPCWIMPTSSSGPWGKEVGWELKPTALASLGYRSRGAGPPCSLGVHAAVGNGLSPSPR